MTIRIDTHERKLNVEKSSPEIPKLEITRMRYTSEHELQGNRQTSKTQCVTIMRHTHTRKLILETSRRGS